MRGFSVYYIEAVGVITESDGEVQEINGRIADFNCEFYRGVLGINKEKEFLKFGLSTSPST